MRSSSIILVATYHVLSQTRTTGYLPASPASYLDCRSHHSSRARRSAANFGNSVTGYETPKLRVGFAARVEPLEHCTGSEWDDAKTHKKWERHRVAPKEAEDVCFNEPLVLRGGRRHWKRGKRYYAIGQTGACSHCPIKVSTKRTSAAWRDTPVFANTLLRWVLAVFILTPVSSANYFTVLPSTIEEP